MSYLNMYVVLVGKPGAGKTQVLRQIEEMLKNNGIKTHNHYDSFSASGEYIEKNKIEVELLSTANKDMWDKVQDRLRRN